MDNRRLLLAALLSAGVLILWNIIFPPPVAVRTNPDAEPVVAEPARANDPAADPAATSTLPGSLAAELEGGVGESPELVAAVERIEGEREERLELETEHGIAVISSRGGQLVSFLTHGKEGSATDQVQMVRDRMEGAYPFAWVDTEGRELDLNRSLFRATSSGNGKNAQINLEYRSGPVSAQKKFFVNPQGRLEVHASTSLQGWGLLLGPGIRNPDLETLKDGYHNHGAMLTTVDKANLVIAKKVKEPRIDNAAAMEWVALEDTYFLTAVVPQLPLARAHLLPGSVTLSDSGSYGFERLPVDAPKEQLEGPRDFLMVLEPGPGGFEAVAYLGAKDFGELKSFGVGLEKSIRWPKFFRPLTRPLQIALDWLYNNVIANYGFCIILMTVLIKAVLFPLTHKSYTSMQKMQQLNPRMEAVRKKYRPKLKDKQGKPNFEQQRKMNEEIQELFRSEGVNPAGSCLPMLVQLPVFLSFFYLLRGAPELWHAPWVGWIKDLAAPDPIYVLPVLMGITQFLSTKMMPAPPNPTQRILMNTFPLWFAFIALRFPAGLVLYWVTNNILTIVQQGGYNRLKKAGLFGGPDTKVEGKPA